MEHYVLMIIIIIYVKVILLLLDFALLILTSRISCNVVCIKVALSSGFIHIYTVL